MSERKIRILVVDDDSSIRESVRLAIEEQELFNIEVLESEDVDSALAQMKKVPPNIIILDLHLPGRSGFDLMDILNKDKQFAKTKVIMLTVDDTMENVFTASSKGIDEYFFLGKPYNIADLQALVLSLCLPVKV